MPSKRKTRKINESVASAKKNVKKSASKLNVRKDVASAVKNQDSYKKDWTSYDAKGRMGGQSKSIKGRNKAEHKLERTLDMRYGIKQNQEGWNPYTIGGSSVYMNQKAGSFRKHGLDVDRTSKKIDTKKRQVGITRDTPLPKTSDKYFKK
jgi:hypothetical protein|tara:strand:+ start:103 stop:552 length:450 start_codon:yes stop_codon:yes gene_type:complete